MLLTGDLLRLAEGYVEVTPLGPIPVKGLPAPVDVYELVRAGPARSRVQAGAARGLTRFVGREAELDQLRQGLEKARAGHGQIVALVGEPGVGKSRLVWEFTHSHRTRGWLMLESGSVSYAKATPYQAVVYLRQVGGKAMERSAYREAAAGFDQALDALQHLPESRARTEQAIDLHLDASGALLTTGGPAKGIEHIREAEALAEALGDERRLGRALAWLAHVLAYRSLGLVPLRRGDLMQAIPPLERAVELCRVIPARLLFDVAAAHLGYAYVLSGRRPEGVALMEEALADPVATGTANHPLFLAYLGEAHLLAGRREDALAVARRALDLAHRQQERGNEAWVLRLLGEIAAHAEPSDELGMRPLVAHCRLGLGQLSRQAGNPEQAKADVTAAATMYRDMGMRFWLEKAEAMLGSLS